MKTELGVGIESWGGRRDFGRDAYCPGSLRFPSRHISADGPFVFQMKFVEPADGDRFMRLKDSVRKERDHILNRYVSDPLDQKQIRHYILITNISLDGSQRGLIEGEIRKALPTATCHSLSGRDVCDLLDVHPELRKSFPQLLSLRDLETLLEESVGKEIRERSRAAIELAKDILPVFVPTESTKKAWMVLNKEHFCVLEGPPEMGKTAIAWVIAVTQMFRGWEAIVCDDPEDIFRAHSKDRRQVFISDDAFGRTEYDPARGKRWEQNIGRVLRFIDKNHWLIWTSRRYILESALRSMDLDGKAAHFPKPGDILVDATKLEVKEKALILYRHARAKGLDSICKEITKSSARSIVKDPNFTPERIRRFVEEVLPELSGEWPENRAAVEEKVRESIRNPTERMRKTFRALPPPHQWFLISVLQEGSLPLTKKVEKGYTRICPQGVVRPFPEVHKELRESFVKDSSFMGPVINWIHPSYRDLVIDELESTPQMRKHFLRNLSSDSLMLILTEQGRSGPRTFIADDDDWRLVRARTLELATDPSTSATDLLDALSETVDRFKDRSDCGQMLTEVARTVKTRWDNDRKKLGEGDISSFSRFSELISPIPPLPNLAPTLESAKRKLEVAIAQVQEESIEVDDIEESVKILWSISRTEPRALRQAGITVESALIDSLNSRNRRRPQVVSNRAERR